MNQAKSDVEIECQALKNEVKSLEDTIARLQQDNQRLESDAHALLFEPMPVDLLELKGKENEIYEVKFDEFLKKFPLYWTRNFVLQLRKKLSRAHATMENLQNKAPPEVDIEELRNLMEQVNQLTEDLESSKADVSWILINLDCNCCYVKFQLHRVRDERDRMKEALDVFQSVQSTDESLTVEFRNQIAFLEQELQVTLCVSLVGLCDLSPNFS